MDQNIQDIIDRAVKIAIRFAMLHYEVVRPVFIPPVSASSDPGGSFMIEFKTISSASETEWYNE